MCIHCIHINTYRYKRVGTTIGIGNHYGLWFVRICYDTVYNTYLRKSFSYKVQYRMCQWPVTSIFTIGSTVKLNLKFYYTLRFDCPQSVVNLRAGSKAGSWNSRWACRIEIYFKISTSFRFSHLSLKKISTVTLRSAGVVAHNNKTPRNTSSSSELEVGFRIYYYFHLFIIF